MTLRGHAVAGVTGCLVLLAAAPAGACPGADLPPGPEVRPQVRDALVCLLNAERSALGLPALSARRRLESAAQAHSDDMVARRFLAHQREGGPAVLARIRATGYFSGARGGVYGENIGAAAEGRATPAELVRAWMASADHRVNIAYRGFRDIGIGIAFAGRDPAFFADWPAVVLTTDFARRDTRRRCRKGGGGAPSHPRRWCRRR